MTRDDILEKYTSRYTDVLRAIEEPLYDLIAAYMDGIPHIDRISVRAKEPQRFADKACKTNDDETIKYSDPLNEIQDQIGSRITVFYLSDVKTIRVKILQYFTPIEIVKKEPERNAEFGYFGEHFILKIPDDVVPDGLSDMEHPEFFELQIKTLFQHAWSEAEHDLGYKPGVKPLTPDEKRRLAFTSAQAWGADHIFDELFRERTK